MTDVFKKANDDATQATLDHTVDLLLTTLDAERKLHNLTPGQDLYIANSVLFTILLNSAKNAGAYFELEDTLLKLRTRDMVALYTDAVAKLGGVAAASMSPADVLSKLGKK